MSKIGKIHNLFQKTLQAAGIKLPSFQKGSRSSKWSSSVEKSVGMYGWINDAVNSQVRWEIKTEMV